MCWGREGAQDGGSDRVGGVQVLALTVTHHTDETCKTQKNLISTLYTVNVFQWNPTSVTRLRSACFDNNHSQAAGCCQLVPIYSTKEEHILITVHGSTVQNMKENRKPTAGLDLCKHF